MRAIALKALPERAISGSGNSGKIAVLHQSIITLISMFHLFKCSRTGATFWILKSEKRSIFSGVPEPIALQSRAFVLRLEGNCKFLLKTAWELLGTIRD